LVLEFGFWILDFWSLVVGRWTAALVIAAASFCEARAKDKAESAVAAG